MMCCVGPSDRERLDEQRVCQSAMLSLAAKPDGGRHVLELSKPLLTNKVILGSNGSNTHYFANPEFSEELKQITRHV